MTRMCKHMVLVVIFATTFWARHAFLTRINPEIRIRIPDHFWLMLDGAVLAPSQDVCPSVRPSYAGVLSKRLNMSSMGVY